MQIFATISRAHIYQAIGLRDRYKDAVRSEKCVGCPYINDNIESCTGCTNLKTKYINDANRFGYRHRLNANSLKILLYLHFLNPDKKGRVQVSVFDLCSSIGICRACAVSNLKKLEKYGYINAFKTSPAVYHIILNDYEQLYLPAKEGGRGYYAMSLDVFEALKGITNITALRIYLSELLSLDSAATKGQATAESRNITDIRRYLPAYCKRNVIINRLSDNKEKNGETFMTYRHETGSKILRFELNPRYKASASKENMLRAMEDRTQEFIAAFNRNVPLYNSNLPLEHDMEQTFYGMNAHTISLIPAGLFAGTTFITDFAALAVQYGFDIVVNGFLKMYNEYIIKNITIRNPGGLLRTFVESAIKEFLKTA